MVCETFGHTSVTSSSERVRPSSGDSKIPLTLSFEFIRSIFGRTSMFLFLGIQPLSIRIISLVFISLKGVKTLYPAMPFLITLSINN